MGAARGGHLGHLTPLSKSDKHYLTRGFCRFYKLRHTRLLNFKTNGCVQPQRDVFARTRETMINHFAQNKLRLDRVRCYTASVVAGCVFMCSCWCLMRTKLKLGVIKRLFDVRKAVLLIIFFKHMLFSVFQSP